jgi:L-alanine-DL-glutamate epimerase-like enolase superfamily enzyme
MPAIIDTDVEPIEVPLRHAFATAQDTLARQVSRPVRLTLRLDDGTEAVGEAVPVQYVTGETQETATALLRALAPVLRDRQTERRSDALAAVDAASRSHTGGRALRLASPSVWAAIEMALADGVHRSAGTSAWIAYGGAQAEVETDITAPITDDAVARAIAYAGQGFTHFKVKLGRPDPAEDLALLRTLHSALPEACFRLDANQAFDAESALAFVTRALDAGLHIECMEQPVPKHDMAALDAVAARSPVPVFADEAVTCPEAALKLVSETCVQGINVKLMKSGLQGALDIAAIARAAGRKLMIGCMLETRRGIGWALALAAGAGGFSFFDLDSHILLDEPAPVEAGDPVIGFYQDGPRLRISR